LKAIGTAARLKVEDFLKPLKEISLKANGKKIMQQDSQSLNRKMDRCSKECLKKMFTKEKAWNFGTMVLTTTAFITMVKNMATVFTTGPMDQSIMETGPTTR